LAQAGLGGLLVAEAAAMPAAPLPQQLGQESQGLAAVRRQLHNDGWLRLEKGMPDWELVTFVERMYSRYNDRLKQILEEHQDDWFLPDGEQDSGPGAHRPGGLVAKVATKRLQGTGIYVYAAHPSQADEAENDYAYSGPRWYVTCMEAAMRRYSHRGMAPPPPAELQELLWPDMTDRCRPWLTEAGWTIVPESSDPQVAHADICSSSTENARKPHLGRYHHFGWKLDRTEVCTTHVIPKAFTEGSVEAHHYDKFLAVRSPAVIFDSEMLHRGGPTRHGSGWTSTLTVQVSSGNGWPHLADRVSHALMWYTQPLGWVAGDAVDALVKGSWQPALVGSRDDSGLYHVTLATGGALVQGLRDRDLRYRQARPAPQAGAAEFFAVGELVEALFGGEWHEARVTRCNADGTYRVTWRREHTCTDGLEATDLRRSSDLSESVERPGKRRRQRSSSCSGSGNANEADGQCALRESLVQRGWIEFPSGLPASWGWALFDFVEHYYDLFNDIIIRELDSLRNVWVPCDGSQQRHGAFAAAKVSERLKPYGVALYSPAGSQSEDPPYEYTGPRWYVSVTAAALEHFGVAPAPPADLHSALFGHPADVKGDPRARGLGWTLAPQASNPQTVHADIWGVFKHARTDRSRWPHILWKRSRAERCTTQIVPGAFTEGAVWSDHYSEIIQVSAPAVVMDSEMLHRGAPTPPAPPSAVGTAGWKSTLSLELCSPSGWLAWEAFETGGTTKDPTSTLDWRMLRIRSPSSTGGTAGMQELSAPESARSPSQTSVPVMPSAPWTATGGLERLRQEQRQWELFS